MLTLYTALTKIEMGVIKQPSVVDGEQSRTMFVVAKIAKALGISVDDLLS